MPPFCPPPPPCAREAEVFTRRYMGLCSTEEIGIRVEGQAADRGIRVEGQAADRGIRVEGQAADRHAAPGPRAVVHPSRMMVCDG